MYLQKANQPVFLYPGQGELHVGFGQDIYNHSQAARDIFDINTGLRDLCFQGPPEKLNDPYCNQAANFMAWIAISAALKEANVVPCALAGQSLGEYAALSFAGAFSAADAIPMLKKRAKIMAECIPANSGMCAVIGLETNTVEQYCADASEQQEPCTIATYSTTDRNVITGSNLAVERCAELCRGSGARTMPVKVPRAFHSPLAHLAKEKFAKELQDFPIHQPSLPIYYNRDGSTECDSIDEMLAEQLVRPVQLTKMINHMLKDGFRQFVKIGSSGFFGNAVRTIARDQGLNVTLTQIESFGDIQEFSSQLRTAEDSHV
jgi:[acyl-carrier-protein] S-malonyltransferase